MTILDPPTAAPLPPLVAGDRLDQPTFHARYLAMPEGTRAELIEGIVYIPPPVGDAHNVPHGNVVFWLHHYKRFTRGVSGLNDATTILGPRAEPQPDAGLRVVVGGQTRLTAEGYVAGPPELVVEVANSTAAYDLRAKRRDYDRHGVMEYVAVVVRRPRVAWFSRNAKGQLSAASPDADGIYRSRAFPGLWLDPVALLADDLDRLAAVLDQGIATPAHAAFVAELAARAGANPAG